jgi:hypothetical protein
MLVSIYPGVSRPDVFKTLQSLGAKAHDTVNIHGPAMSRVAAHLSWAAESARMLQSRVSPADIDRLVFTRGYERILATAGSMPEADRVLNELVNQEVQQRERDFEEAAKDLQEQMLRWPPGFLYAVADTSFYIEHEKKIEEADLAPLLDSAFHDKRVVLIVPIIVLDELDGLKNRGSGPHVKWRAAYTLAVFDRIFTKRGEQGKLQMPSADPARGGVLADILFDPPRHERLPIADDEIVDRALAAQGLTGSTVTLLTFDTGQAARARNAGLAVNKLDKELGEEPEDTRKKKA